MIEISLLGFISVLFAWKARYKNNYLGLKISFLIIFLFTAFRYDFGTDYSSYHSLFEEIIQHTTYTTLNSEDFRIETGWLILNYLFKPLGFYIFIVVLSGFFSYTYYYLIKKYVPENYYWLAVFIYIFFYNLLLIQLSAIRQTLGISIFLFSINYVIEGRGSIKFILLTILSSFFHSSSLYLLLLVIFYIPKIRQSLKVGHVIIILFIFLLVFGQVISSYFPTILSTITGNRYEVWYESEIASEVSFLGGLLWFTLLYIVVSYSRMQTENMRLIYNFCAIFFLVYPLTVIIFLSDRMGYYFAPFCLIVFPHILSIEQNRLKKNGLLAFFLIFVMYNFFKFFTIDYVVDSQGYDNYQTIFSVL